jgi:uncharacterized protein (TIGR02217 family)
MDFLDVSFPSLPSFGYTAEPRYSVSIIQRASGHERRNANWSYPLHRYTVTVGPRAEAEVAALLEFWHAVGGSAYAFRFKDFADYLSCRIGSTFAATDQPLVSLGTSPNTYQLTKRYTTGALLSPIARTQSRPITKPVSGKILIADNSTLKTETTHYTLDYATGVVSLHFTPSGALTWGGEFDVPVRFDSEFPVEILSRRIQSVQAVLAEVRV